MEMERYFERLEGEVKEAYAVAIEARRQGHDPELRPEIPFAKDLAERVEGLVGPKGVSGEIRELSLRYPKEEVAIQIAKEIVEGKYKASKSVEETSEQALRTALAILTDGIVAAPLEGIVKVKIKKNHDNTTYLAIYFAGPIRSAGGSAQALAVLIGDYVRRGLNLDKYKPTNDEVERFAEEVELYNSEAARLQYLPSSQEVRKAIRNIPVEVTGESTDQVEVSGYRDLERIETNQVRGGAILVLAEGVLQKAPKILKHVKKLRLEGWEWLNDFAEKQGISKDNNEIDIGPNYKYIKDLIAGRPVLAHPSAKGGLRLRYGRSRSSGLASMSLHPATMVMLDEFIVTGTQIKTERPGKGSAVSSCDSIEGPIVKLADGSVVRVESEEQANEIKSKVKEILFLGDILVSYGDFLENNHVLLPAGYCEEWWVQELEQALRGKKEYERFLDIKNVPSQEEAIEISEELKIPLHPRYTYFFNGISKEEFKSLVNWLCTGEIESGALILRKSEEKKILEALGVPHKVRADKVIIEEYKPLLKILGIDWTKSKLSKAEGLSPEDFSKVYERKGNAMEIINSFGIEVREKAPTFIGARMGRPEKAKERKMQPAVNVLFPIGQAGGRTRDIKKAAQKDKILVDLARRECPRCKEVTFKTLCPSCNTETELQRVCISCGRVTMEEICRACGSTTRFFESRELEVKESFNSAVGKVGNTYNDIKGVIGMTSTYKIPEPLEKGILRSKNNVYVFKDGTVRFDATDIPLTHFRPREVGVSVERLKELGYDKHSKGKPLESEDQVVELKCQDIIISEGGADYLVRAAKFLDELLVKFYGLKPFYNAEAKEDLLGHLVLGLAPHTSAAILGRIIGFTKANVGFAHPYFHAAKRRNCDGDEDAIFLVLDALINFSRAYLPSTRGGKMDAPLVLTTRLDPREIDDEAHNIDIVQRYPLEFYEASMRYAKPQELESVIETVGNRIGKPEQYFGLGFTHDTKDIAAGPKTSAYKTLGAMMEKVKHQLALANKIRAVDERDVAKRVIESHFLPDLAGNLRAFSKQSMRCVSCNTKYRRVPLTGKCRKCGGKLVLTVSKGSVEKYLQVTQGLIDNYGLDDYLRQRIKILEMSIASVFDDDAVKQVSLSDFLVE